MLGEVDKHVNDAGVANGRGLETPSAVDCGRHVGYRSKRVGVCRFVLVC
jgi:hypothetical protein